MLPFTASASIRQDVNPGKNAQPLGAVGCTWGAARSTYPLGGVFERAEDKPGSKGNEISQISAVFVRETRTTGLAGWYYQAFDGKAAFEPLVTPGSRAVQFFVSPTPRNFNLAPWLSTATKEQQAHGSALQFLMDPELISLARKKHVLAEVMPCFGKPWDGVNYR